MKLINLKLKKGLLKASCHKKVLNATPANSPLIVKFYGILNKNYKRRGFLYGNIRLLEVAIKESFSRENINANAYHIGSVIVERGLVDEFIVAVQPYKVEK